MAVIRAFIAVSLSGEIQNRLDHVIRDLKARLLDAPIRWVPSENIHLTLKFLGDVSVANLEVLKRILQSAGLNFTPFELSVGKLGAYPSMRRPRVIWVGVEAPNELEGLQRTIESETARLGYTGEERPFSPHLTLGRIGRNANAADVRMVSTVLGSVKVGFLGATRIEAVHLYRSDLKPGGAIYTRLYSAGFGE